MYNHRQGFPSLPPPPLPLPPPHHHLHFHPHGYRPYYYSAPPQPILKFYTPTHLIQQQQYQQYQVNRRIQSSNNTYQRTSTNKKEAKPDDTPNSMISNTIHTKPAFSFIRSIKATTNWIAETFCFCSIDDNSHVFEMNDRQTNVKNTLKK